MSAVVDASLLVAATTDAGAEGRWAEEVVGAGNLVAPDLALVEATNILRRLELAGRLERLEAGAAARDLVEIQIELVPFAPFAATGLGVARYRHELRRLVRRGRGRASPPSGHRRPASRRRHRTSLPLPPAAGGLRDSDQEKREHLESLSYEQLKGDPLFDRGREISHRFQLALDRIFLEPDSPFYDLTLKYGVF